MLDNSTIFITGGTGSWGNELCAQLLERYNPKEIRIYSRGEHKQVEMKRVFGNNPKIKFIIGDVRDKNILGLAMKGSDYVFHLAALKHVPVCEENCWEAVLTNIYGTQNVIECAIENNVKKVIDISTDKAVDPFNLYGVTKACGEKLIINSNWNYNSQTKFVCIRGGNVMGTNGSVIPLFKKQIEQNNEVTVTDPSMTRFLMSTKEAINLVLDAVESSVGGEVFVMRMPSMSVEDLTKALIKMFGTEETKITVIGTRPGEKTSEVLVSKNESPRTKVFDDKYYVILPQREDSVLSSAYDSMDNISLDEFSSDNAERIDIDSFIDLLNRDFDQIFK